MNARQALQMAERDLDTLDGIVTRTRELLRGVPGAPEKPLDVAVADLVAELQAAKDRASTSYREGYEAGRAYAYETRNSGPPGVLMGAKPTLEEALELIRASRDHYRNAAWEADAGLTSTQEQLRLMTKERDALKVQVADVQETADALKRQLTESQESLHHAINRFERAEKERDGWREEAVLLRRS